MTTQIMHQVFDSSENVANTFSQKSKNTFVSGIKGKVISSKKMKAIKSVLGLVYFVSLSIALILLLL